MEKISQRVRYVDEKRLIRIFIAGIKAVINNQEHLNAINVFPVPDRDTGTNLAITLSTMLISVEEITEESLSNLLETVSDAGLNGSRGNSGAIFAQFFVGLNQSSIPLPWNAQQAAIAIQCGFDYATRAVTKPKEGTILTVMKTFADTFLAGSENETDFYSLWENSLNETNKTLQKTSTQLDECRHAGVVDAGAQGFIDFLTGINDFLLKGSLYHYKILKQSDIDIVIPPEAHAIDDGYRFCTECLIEGEDINHDILRNELLQHGCSLIIAGHNKKTKLHIHTNNPTEVFEYCRSFGRIRNEKADDMIHQQSDSQEKVAILTDSAADFTKETTEKYHIHVIPLGINFGRSSYADKLSLSPKQFYKKIFEHNIHPTSSQPSAGDFKRAYEYLSSHYRSIIAIHLPEKHSGTLNASRMAAQQYTPKNYLTTFIDAGTISGGQGLIVSLAAKAEKAGYSHHDIVNLTNKHQNKTKQYAAVPDLSFAVKGGRIPSWKKKLLAFFRITPILSFNNKERISVSSLIIGKKQFANKFIRYIHKLLDNKKRYEMIIEHCNNFEAAKEIKGYVDREIDKIDSCHIIEASPVLGIHAGPGSVGIAFQESISVNRKIYDKSSGVNCDKNAHLVS
ncbi:MAG: hypothetical protein CL816_02520 [Coxiellaceae bacterium]|nr:hypothetical protein [Coxiellaceae bacterium]